MILIIFFRNDKKKATAEDGWESTEKHYARRLICCLVGSFVDSFCLWRIECTSKIRLTDTFSVSYTFNQSPIEQLEFLVNNKLPVRLVSVFWAPDIFTTSRVSFLKFVLEVHSHRDLYFFNSQYHENVLNIKLCISMKIS